MPNNVLRKAVTCAVFLSLVVVMLGAYTRLTDAGLGCPDWPGCYGQMVVPQGNTLKEAQVRYPQLPVEAKKAWTEMIHRYAAGTLALLIFLIGLSVLRSQNAADKLPWHLPICLVVLVIFQALLGMWTVTLKLLPIVVMSHLLGGMIIIACLTRFRLQISSLRGKHLPQWRFWLRLGVLIVFIQIALGGWVSSNYAGISCIGFPQCNGFWFPKLHFTQGFNLFSPVGLNYQGGLLDNEVRASIQFVHRIGAFLTVTYILLLSLVVILKRPSRYLRNAALISATLVMVQFILGVMNVIYLLPLEIAVAHNGVAALLLATIFNMLHFTYGEKNG